MPCLDEEGLLHVEKNIKKIYDENRATTWSSFSNSALSSSKNPHTLLKLSLC